MNQNDRWIKLISIWKALHQRRKDSEIAHLILKTKKCGHRVLFHTTSICSSGTVTVLRSFKKVSKLARSKCWRPSSWFCIRGPWSMRCNFATVAADWYLGVRSNSQNSPGFTKWSWSRSRELWRHDVDCGSGAWCERHVSVSVWKCLTYAMLELCFLQEWMI